MGCAIPLSEDQLHLTYLFSRILVGKVLFFTRTKPTVRRDLTSTFVVKMVLATFNYQNSIKL